MPSPGRLARLLRYKLTARDAVLAVVLTGLTAYLSIGAIAAWALTRRPLPWRAEPLPALTIQGSRLKHVRLETRDGVVLGSWFLQGQPDKPIVLLLHGIAASRSGMIEHVKLVGREGNGVLALSLRAHGDSSGDKCDIGWSDRNDVVAAVEFIHKEAPNRPIVIFGSSMGAAAAIFAAAELKDQIAGYALEVPYGSLLKATRIRVDSHVPYPWNELAYLDLKIWAPVFLPVPLDEISPLKHMTDFPAETPVLILGGGKDYEAPVSDLKLMVAARPKNTTLEVFTRATHVQLWASEPDRFESLLLGFIRDAAKPRGPSTAGTGVP